MCLLISIFCIICIGLLLNQMSYARRPKTRTLKSHFTSGRVMDERVPSVVEPTDDEWNANITQFNCVVCYKTHPIGSGAVLSSKYVLTTCQSIYKVVSPDFIIYDDVEVRWGVFRSDVDGIIILTTRANNVYPGPDCFGLIQEFNSVGDLAIIEATHPLTFNKFLNFVSLPKPSQFAHCNMINRYLFLSNFKMLDVATSLAESVWMVKTALIGPDICYNLMDRKVYSMRSNICASYAHFEGPDNCTVDVGSALSYDNMLCGLLSYKEGCGGEHSVASFVSISRYVPWIQQIMWGNPSRRKVSRSANVLQTKT